MKRWKSWIAALCMTVSMTMTAFGAQWMQDNSGWWYQNDDGSYPTSSWQWIDGNQDGLAERYYFDANGYCLINTWTPDGQLVDGNGAWIVGGVVQTQPVSLPANTASSQNTAGSPSTAGLSGSQNVGNFAPEPPNTAVSSGTWQSTGTTTANTTGNISAYPTEATVWLSATGSKYHRIPNCGRMNPNKARQVSLEQAVAQGYERCKNCY